MFSTAFIPLGTRFHNGTGVCFFKALLMTLGVEFAQGGGGAGIN